MRTLPLTESNSTIAWLESTPREGQEPLRAELTRFPFTIGRNDSCDFTIESPRISREHLRIVQTPSGYAVHDLGSTNGTYVNGVKIAECALSDGDLLTVANYGLVFHLPKSLAAANATQPFMGSEEPLEQHAHRSAELIEAVRRIQEAALCRGSRGVVRAVMEVESSEAVGYEIETGLLSGRGSRPLNDLDCPAVTRALDLSRLIAVEQVWEQFGDVPMFLPLLGREAGSNELLDSLERIRQRSCGEAQLVVQVPPEGQADLARWRGFRDQLRDIGVVAAFDRFGGNADDLAALGDHAPGYLRFDATALSALGRTSEERRRVAELVQVGRDLQIQSIGGDVRTEEQWQACKILGIALVQGDFASAPQMLDACGGKRPG